MKRYGVKGMEGKKKRKRFLVNVFHTYAYSVVVEAGAEEEAERLVEKAEADGRLDPADFRKTDGCEIEVFGRVDNDDPNPWPVLEVEYGKDDRKVGDRKRAPRGARQA